MQTIKLKVKDKLLFLTEDSEQFVVVGDNDSYFVAFELDEPKTAVFAVFKRADKQQLILLDEEGKVNIPMWCLKSGCFCVGLVSDGYSTTAKVIEVRGSVADKEAVLTQDPEPDIVNQLIGLVNELKEKEVSDSKIMQLLDDYISENPITASNGVREADINRDGELILTLFDDTRLNCGKVRASLGNGLKLDENGKMCVEIAQEISQGNTLPVSSAMVHTELGNINILLTTI